MAAATSMAMPTQSLCPLILLIHFHCVSRTCHVSLSLALSLPFSLSLGSCSNFNCSQKCCLLLLGMFCGSFSLELLPLLLQLCLPIQSVHLFSLFLFHFLYLCSFPLVHFTYHTHFFGQNLKTFSHFRCYFLIDLVAFPLITFISQSEVSSMCYASLKLG